MKMNVKSLPLFVTEALRLAALRGNEPFGSLTINEAEKVLKTWVYVAIDAVKGPEEASAVYFTRQEAATQLGVSPVTVDQWVKRGHLTYKRIGERKIFMESDLAQAIRNENSKQDVQD